MCESDDAKSRRTERTEELTDDMYRTGGDPDNPYDKRNQSEETEEKG